MASKTYFLEISKDIPTSIRQNMANFIRANGTHDARLVDGGIGITRRARIGYLESPLVFKIGYNKKLLNKAKSRAFSWLGGMGDVKPDLLAELRTRTLQLEGPTSAKNIEQMIRVFQNFIGLLPREKYEISLDEALTVFFKFFPNGQFVVFSKPKSYYSALRLTSLLVAQKALSNEDISELIPDDWEGKGISAFGKGQPIENRNYLNLPLQFCNPAITGFSINGIESEAVALYGGEMRVDDIINRNKIFGVDFQMWGDDANVGRFGLTPDSQGSFLSWYVNKLNHFLGYILDFTNFSDHAGKIYPEQQYALLLTIDSLFEIVTRISASSDPLTRKLLSMDFFDRYLHVIGKKQIEDLICVSFFNKEVRPALQTIEDEGLRNGMINTFEKILETFCNTTAENVFQDGRKSEGHVLLGRHKERKVTYEEYAGKFIDALRDTTHSYMMKDPARLLELIFINNGNVSSYISCFPQYLLLTLVVNHERLLMRYANIRTSGGH